MKSLILKKHSVGEEQCAAKCGQQFFEAVQHLAPAPAPHGKPMPLLEVTSRKWAQGALLSCEMIPLDDATNPHSVD